MCANLTNDPILRYLRTSWRSIRPFLRPSLTVFGASSEVGLCETCGLDIGGPKMAELYAQMGQDGDKT